MTYRHTPEEWRAMKLEMEARERALTQLINELSRERQFVRSALEQWGE